MKFSNEKDSAFAYYVGDKGVMNKKDHNSPQIIPKETYIK